MTDAELLDKIKAEIERRIEEYNIQSLRGNELAGLLSFLDTLQPFEESGKLKEETTSNPE